MSSDLSSGTRTGVVLSSKTRPSFDTLESHLITSSTSETVRKSAMTSADVMDQDVIDADDIIENDDSDSKMLKKKIRLEDDSLGETKTTPSMTETTGISVPQVSNSPSLCVSESNSLLKTSNLELLTNNNISEASLVAKTQDSQTSNEEPESCIQQANSKDDKARDVSEDPSPSGSPLAQNCMAFGVSFEGVISFNNSGDSTCTLSARIDSDGLFKVLTANVFTFRALPAELSNLLPQELKSIHQRDLYTEKANIVGNSSKKTSNLVFMLCFSCHTSYSDIVGLSDHGKICHNCVLTDEEKTFFESSNSTVVFQPSNSEGSEIIVLVLDNIREVSLESLKIASRHFVQDCASIENDDSDSSAAIDPLLTNESSFVSLSSANQELVSNSNNILSHMAMCHSRNSSKTLKCPKCNWHYKYQQTLEAHMKEKHSESTNNCEFCANNEPHPKLSRGESYSCGYKPFKCEVCNYSTTTKGNLSIHMQSDKHLNNVQELKRNNGSLEETSNAISTTISAAVGANCNQPGSTSSGSEQASNPQTSSYFKCPVCDFQTSSSSTFKLHVATEHALIPQTTSGGDLASAILTQQQQQQQSTADILQSLILQRQLEAVAAVTNPDPVTATSLFLGSLDGVPQGSVVSQSSVVGSSLNESGIFTCSLCYKFCTDDAHLIQNHALRDRTNLTSQEYSLMNNNTFKCLLCNYSTNLKANFTLHSQTEKHKQKVQIFNHLKEGNETVDAILTVIHQISPIQITCNACDFQAKSIGQLNAHLTTDIHVLAVKLFEIFTSLSSKPGARFNCKLCKSGFLSKAEIISHVQQPLHCAKLRNQKAESGMNLSDPSWQDYFEISTDVAAEKAPGVKNNDLYGEAFNCPLCAKPSRSRDLLREHILQDHRVSNDCIEGLLAVVKPTMSVKPVARIPKVTKPVADVPVSAEPQNPPVTNASAISAVNVTAAASIVLNSTLNQPPQKYRCHRCRNEFVHTYDLYEHLKSCLSYLCFSVPDCKQSFPTHNALSTHIQSHPDQDSSLPCWEPNCGHSFLSEENLIQHFFESNHLPPALTCSTCLTTFLSETTFSNHVLSSSCNQQITYSSQSEFKNEILDSFPIVSQYSCGSISSRPFTCSRCNFAFVLQENLNSHIELAHCPSGNSSNTNPNSSSCSESLMVAPEPTIRSRNPETNPKPYRCDVCDVAYSSESTLLIHMASLLHKDTVKRQAEAASHNRAVTSPSSITSSMTSCNSTNDVTQIGSGNFGATGQATSLPGGLVSPAAVKLESMSGLSVTPPQGNGPGLDINKLVAQQSSLAALNFLSRLGSASTGGSAETKAFQDALLNQQLLSAQPVLDMQTQMALLQQQQFLLQQQKLLSTLMPFYNLSSQIPAFVNCNKCGQYFATQESLSEHQLICCNSKLSELFKISISGNATTSSGDNEDEKVPAHKKTASSEVPNQSVASENNSKPVLESSQLGTTTVSTSSLDVFKSLIKSELSSPKSKLNRKDDNDLQNDQTSENLSENIEKNQPEIKIPSAVPEDSSRVEVSNESLLNSNLAESFNLRCESSGNLQDEDDDNMFYSDDVPQSESDGCNSDYEGKGEFSVGSSSSLSNDQLNANTVLLQQAALYQQLLMQNPAALSSMLPAAALASGGINSQMVASNPILSLLASAAVTSSKALQSLCSPDSSQKQPRTKISEPQLEILRQNFDISNLPNEERYVSMSEQTGLPIKVIKHWFRNTLFKERQKDKDSPYNFSNPPSSSSNGSSSSCSANTLALQQAQAIFNNMQNILPATSTPNNAFEAATKFSLNPFAANQPGKPPSPMSMFLQQQNQQSGSTKRATRTRFTDGQIKALQDFFDQNPYPRDDDLENLSRTLNLSPRVVVVWFQNQRQKARRNLEGTNGSENPYPAQNTSQESMPTGISIAPSASVQPPQNSSSLSASRSLDTDANKVIQEVVNMFAVSHNTSPVVRTIESLSHEKNTTVVEPQAAPNYEINFSDCNNVKTLTTQQNTATSCVNVTNSNNNDNLSALMEENDNPKLVIKEEPEFTAEHNSQLSSLGNRHEEEFFYTCSFCPVIVASEEELELHQRSHMESQNLLMNGNGNADVTNEMEISKLKSSEISGLQDKFSFEPSMLGANDGIPYLNDSQSSMDGNSASSPGGCQEYFRRMRTTISPDQLEILYTKYGENSNPSRMEMEAIANSVGLSRRVVQVWYQNTRARQRRGQCRVIGNTVYHCKCPYCDTVCKSKSHLSQHVQKEHADRAKNAIQIASSGGGFESGPNGIRTAGPPNVTIATKLTGNPLDENSNSGASMIQNGGSINFVNNHKSLESLVASVNSIVSAASRNFGASLSSLGMIEDSESKDSENADPKNSKTDDENDDSKLAEVSFYSDASK